MLLNTYCTSVYWSLYIELALMLDDFMLKVENFVTRWLSGILERMARLLMFSLSSNSSRSC